MTTNGRDTTELDGSVPMVSCDERAVPAIGRVIEIVRFDPSAAGESNGTGVITLTFVDGSELRLINGGGDCCASVTMSCDDDLQSFTGDKFLGYDVLSVDPPDSKPDDYEVHEMQFLHIRTSGGTITCESHNHHNGYYSGLWITPKFVAA